MYTPNLSEFQKFSLERLLVTCFGAPASPKSYCVLIDLESASDVVGLSFLQNERCSVQQTAYNLFYEPLNSTLKDSLLVERCDFLSFNQTGGSNLDPDDQLIDMDGNELSFKRDLSRYDIILALTDYSLTAPLTALAKKQNFRGATLHGLNEIILNSGLSVDYKFVSKQAESLRLVLDNADSFTITFECLGESFSLEIGCGKQTAQKSHGLCPEGSPDIANLPAGEVYFVPNNASGSFPFRFADGTIAQMDVRDGSIFQTNLLCGSKDLLEARNLQLSQDPATGVIGELGFGTQLLPFSGKDIQDEKIFGTCHIATGRSDHLGGHLVPELFACSQNASHDDILFAPPKTPEIDVSKVTMHKDNTSEDIFKSFKPTQFLLSQLQEFYPVDKLGN